MRIWKRLIQTIGVVTFVLSLWGFYWLADGFWRELVRPLRSSGAPFFRQVFFAMNAIDAIVLTAMILTAIGLVLLRPSAMKVYTWLYLALVVYAFAPGMLWGLLLLTPPQCFCRQGLGPLLFFPFPFAYAVLSVGLVNLAMRELRTPTDRLDSSGVPVAPR